MTKKSKKKEIADTIGQLKDIFPSKRVKLSNGKNIDVTPVPVSMLPQFIEDFVDIIEIADKFDLKIHKKADVVRAGTIATKSVISILTKLLKKPVEYFDTLQLSDLVAIITALIELNNIDDIIKNVKSLGDLVKEKVGQ